jgi:phosphatidylglycerophosphate synthase
MALNELFYDLDNREHVSELKKYRTQKFTRILKVLDSLGLTPNMLSFSTIFFILLLVLTIKNYPGIALFMLWFAMLIDGLDGSLARYKKMASDKGKFTDMMCDSINFTLVMVGFVIAGLVNPILAIIYVYFMLLLKVFIIVKRQLTQESDWLVHPMAGFFPNIPIILSVLFFTVYAIFATLFSFWPIGIFLTISNVTSLVIYWSAFIFVAFLIFETFAVYLDIKHTTISKKKYMTNKFNRKKKSRRKKS